MEEENVGGEFARAMQVLGLSIVLFIACSILGSILFIKEYDPALSFNIMLGSIFLSFFLAYLLLFVIFKKKGGGKE